MSRLPRLLVPGILLVLLTTACQTTSSVGAPSFTAALANVLTYAHDQIGHDFAANACEACEVRVIKPQSVERYVPLDQSGYKDDHRRQVEEAIRRNKGLALVVTNLREKDSASPVNVVFLPAGKTVPGSDATSFLLTNGSVTRACPSIGVFGRIPQDQFCTCALGICCPCGCRSCATITAPSLARELDLPPPWSRLLEGSQDMESYPLDTNLLRQ